RHIITLEDPIEYYHNHIKCLVNQREIGVDVPDFKEGIRRALRMAPDVILVGEMRDLETIHAAIEAAETGHVVFATLHTATASRPAARTACSCSTRCCTSSGRTASARKRTCCSSRRRRRNWRTASCWPRRANWTTRMRTKTRMRTRTRTRMTTARGVRGGVRR